jgi:hypothetical protein
MQIINNTTGLSENISLNYNTIEKSIKNHEELLSALIPQYDKVVIASPFLMNEFEKFFENINIQNIEFQLITTCKAKGDEQIVKPFQMKNFGTCIKKLTQKWPEIHLINSLHSKIYLFYKNNKATLGIVTSANFTNNGLVKNHETGVVLQDSNILQNLELDLNNNLEYISLAEFQIDKLCTIADLMKKEKRYEKQEDININLLKNIENNCTPSAGNRNIKLRDSATYYISVAGVTENPILPQDKRKVNKPHSDIWFAKEPKTMKEGDCLLEVAVGGKCFLSYYAITSRVFTRTIEEQKNKEYKRWPFYVYANNLSLNYGEKWFEKPLYYKDILEEFKIKFPNTPVTVSGKDSFVGAIQIGHSFVKVTREFGEFVRKRIDEQ